MTSTSAGRPSFAAMCGYFLRLGLIGFGGPPAHIALMRRELVDDRRWLDAEQFSADLSTANLLPGPTSTEVAIYAGHRLHGAAGAIGAGVCFILPAFVLVTLIAVAYVANGNAAWLAALLYAVKPVALALVVSGVLQLGKPVARSVQEAVVFFAALAALLLAKADVLSVYVAGGILYVALVQGRNWLKGINAGAFLVAPAQASLSTALGGWQQAAEAVPALLLFWTFLKIGALIYGGGFALIGVLQQLLVTDLGWLTQTQLLDGIAIGQSTPGPVFTTAAFVGYLVGGLPGAAVATLGIFAPAFVFVLLENALFGRIKNAPLFRDFLKGVNAAVVASLVLAAAQLGGSALPDVLTIAITIAAFVLTHWKNIGAHWLVGAALLIGLTRLAVS